jgi:hypothetical protein
MGPVKENLSKSAKRQSNWKIERVAMNVSQTKVLASNRQTTNGEPEHQRLHHWRLSREKKYCVIIIIEK